MDIEISNNFSQYYAKFRTDFPNLVELNADVISELDFNLKRDKQKNRTIRYLQAVLAANFTIYLLPILFFAFTRCIESIVANLILIKSSSTIMIIGMISISLCLGVFATILYLFLLPQFSKALKQKSKIIKLFAEINKKSKEFISFSIILCYIGLGSILFILLLNFSWDQIMATIIACYILLPFFLLSAFILMIISIRFISIPIFSLLNNKNHPTSEIVIRLLELLKSISSIKNIHTLESNRRIWIKNRIDFIAMHIAVYPKDINNGNLEEILYKSASHFSNLSNAFIMPKKDSLMYCQNEIIIYCNCFLSGDIDALPRDNNANKIENKKERSRILSLIYIVAYLLIPIFIYFIIDYFIKIELNEFKQSILRLAYIFWTLIGITSNHTIFNSETKEMIKEIIGTFTKNK